jgi:hypothetical protein
MIPLFLFIIYVVLDTTIISTLFVENWQDNLYGGYFREKGRFITSLLRIIVFNVGVFFILAGLIQNREKIFRLLQIYLKSLIILSVLGIIQLLIFILFQFDILPMTNQLEGINSTAVVDYILTDVRFIRVNSLGGEPKGLAASLCVGITILLFALRFKLKLINRQIIWINIFLLVVILTLSSGGLGLLAFLFLGYLSISVFTGLKRSKFSYLKLTYAIMLIIILFASYQPLKKVVESRIFERSSELLSEDVDQAIQSFLYHNPRWLAFGVGNGNIHNFAYDYIDSKYLKRLMKNQIFVSRYGLFEILSESGLIGLLIFLIVISYYLFIISVSRFHNREWRFFFSILFVLILFYFFRADYVVSELYFILSLGSISAVMYNSPNKSYKSTLSFA